MPEEHEIYKITSINEDGAAVTVYVIPSARRMIAKSMMEEYGNVEEQGMAKSEVPDGVIL